MNEKFAQRLDMLIRQDSRTAAEIAAAAGIGAPYLSQLRKGVRGSPKIEVAAKLAEVLNVPLSLLLTGQPQAATLPDRQDISDSPRTDSAFGLEATLEAIPELGRAEAWNLTDRFLRKLLSNPNVPRSHILPIKWLLDHLRTEEEAGIDFPNP